MNIPKKRLPVIELSLNIVNYFIIHAKENIQQTWLYGHNLLRVSVGIDNLKIYICTFVTLFNLFTNSVFSCTLSELLYFRG